MATFRVVKLRVFTNCPTPTHQTDTTPLVFGTIPDPATSRARTPRTAGSQSQSKATTIAKLLLSGSSLNELIHLDPGYSLQNLIKMRTFASACAQLQQSAPRAQWPSNLSLPEASSVTQRLVEWCNLNFGSKRAFKQHQLYLHGPSNMRKITFLNICKFFNSSYAIPTGEDFYDLYQDPEPTLCYIDEFEGKKVKPLGWLKEFSQGTEMNLRIKGGQRMKYTNPAIILLSNFSLEQVYKKALLQYPTCLEPIYERFLVVEATEPIDNQLLVEALVSALLATTAPPSAEIIQELRSLISSPLGVQSSSALNIVPCNVPSQDGATSTTSVSSVTEEQETAPVDGTPEPESSNQPMGALLALMTPPQGMPTASAKQSKHEKFMEARRKKIREQSEERISSIDRIRMKGSIRLYDGNDDDLLQ